jgi:hypothetical protein
MTTPPLPPVQPVPSGKLFKSTLVALLVAGLLLVTVVLPAEYGIDPTGVGRPLGLTRMGEIKTRLAREAAADAAEDARAAAAEDSAAAADSARTASPVPPDSTQPKGDSR